MGRVAGILAVLPDGMTEGPMTELARREVPLILEVVKEIAKPEKVILFGSQAEGGAGPESDIDLCIVADAQGGAIRLQTEIREKLYRKIVSPLDLVILSPERFLERSTSSASFEAGIAARGIVLYG